jgi:peptide/nickel transport system substrate-binding protein
MAQPRLSRRTLLRAAAAAAAARALAPSPATAQRPRILRFRLARDIQVLDPAFVGGLDDGHVLNAISSKLIVYADKGWGWQLDAAQAMEQVDPTRVKFTLRPGIQWTNGFGEMTADDVKFSFERMIDPNLKARNGTDFRLLEQVQVLDRHSGVLVFKSPFPALWLTVLPRSAGTIMCRKAVEAAPGGRFTTTPPTTSGPYVIKEWRPKESLTLARNPQWNGPRMDFDEIRFRVIGDTKAAELAYEAGEIDFTDIAVSSVPKFQKSPLPGTKVVATPLVGIEWLGINVEHPLFTDVRVRKAIQRAIDVDAVVQAEYFGVARPATGLVAPGMLGHRERSLVKRDLAEARRLLAAAGKPNGFQTTLAVLNETDLVTGAQVIQANLAEIGVTAQITPLESGTFWYLGNQEKSTDWKNIQLYTMRWGLPPDPGAMTQWHISQQIGKWNWERWSNPEFDDLHVKGLTELDSKKRQAIYVRMQDLMEESGAYTFLTNGIQALMYRDWLQPVATPDQRQLVTARFRYAGS